MLDCISGGRLVAGMPLGSPMDANLCYGIPPIEQRERYHEAHDLTLKAWQAREPFPWNGKYSQFALVNLWPRPVQQPHPPVWVPGSGSISTWDFAIKHDHCYCFLSYFGGMRAKTIMDGFREYVVNSNSATQPLPHRSSSSSWSSPRPTHRAEGGVLPAHSRTSTTSASTLSPQSSRTSGSPGLPQPAC